VPNVVFPSLIAGNLYLSLVATNWS